MIEITYDRDMLRQIEKKLGKMRNEAPKVLKDALNLTAKQARTALATEAQKTYTVKSGGFRKAMKLKAASSGRLEAVIKAKGAPLPLKDFRYSKAGGKVRVQVLKSGGLKPLEKGGIKAFINNIAKRGQTRSRDTKKGKAGSSVKHNAIAQRLTKKRLGIEEKFSNSIPVMIGSEKRVYGIVRPDIQKNLQENVEKQVRKVLEKK